MEMLLERIARVKLDKAKAKENDAVLGRLDADTALRMCTTLVNMLRSRGYQLSSEAEALVSKPSLALAALTGRADGAKVATPKASSSIRIVTAKTVPGLAHPDVFVYRWFFSSAKNSETMGVEAIRTYVALLGKAPAGQAGPRRLIIIYPREISSSCVKEQGQLARENGLIIELHPLCFFNRDITTHSLYRPHRALSAEEKAKLYEMFCVSDDSKMPALLTSDPVCRYFAFPVGTVVEILRSDGRQVATLYWRVVRVPSS